MEQIKEGSLLWTPTKSDIENANLTRYLRWLADVKGLSFHNYHELWQWSVDQIGLFWQTLWEFFDIQASKTADIPLAGASMPGAKWFPGAQLNYAENMFHKMVADAPAIIYKDESNPLIKINRQELWDKTKALANTLRRLGVTKGDRVVAYLPNIPEAVIALLAVSSLGAIWSSCPPDFGSRSVLDRFTQIEPKLLIAVDGYEYGGKRFDRRKVLSELQASLPTLERTILLPFMSPSKEGLKNTILWEDVVNNSGSAGDLIFTQVPFDHPLWILYSSGTTGMPKPIVQGHGGILLEHLKSIVFHNDIKPGDRFFWFSSTGWMMWNYVIGTILSGASIILYNGSPAYPDMNTLFALAEETSMTYFGTSAAFISACMKAGIHPNKEFNLKLIRGVGSTGSPLSVEGFAWVYENINSHLALESLSGGTDLCTAFVGGARILPIYAGEIQGASLGAKVLAFNEDGEQVINEVGELVITKPMPSMPLFFWNDPEMTRYKESYFEMFPGIWRHGDWILFNVRGGCIIYGRSDSTINRHGIRMGTSEIYRVVESFEDILDSLIIDLELLGRESFLPLFVVLSEDVILDDTLKQAIKQNLRQDVSPRHVPDEIIQIDQVPYTLSGKKMEVPIRKILLGIDKNKAANIGAMRNPEAIDFFVQYARTLARKSSDA